MGKSSGTMNVQLQAVERKLVMDVVSAFPPGLMNASLIARTAIRAGIAHVADELLRGVATSRAHVASGRRAASDAAARAGAAPTGEASGRACDGAFRDRGRAPDADRLRREVDFDRRRAHQDPPVRRRARLQR